jgi:putative DNA primase/helicase
MNFLTFLQSSGFIVDRVDPDGKWHRCGTQDHPKTKNGAYKLALDGLVGFMQNHATETEVTTWKAGADVARPDPIISMQRAKEAKDESIRILIEATSQAAKFWSNCKPLRKGHPYLDAKLLSMHGCTNLRIDSDGWLVIPVEVNGCIISLQRIAPDGTKRFWSGASVKGGCYVLTRANAAYTVLCEGFATGLAIFQAMPDARVIVCFDCGNMGAVVNRLKLSGLCVVAADNDYSTMARIGKNPGIEHGKAAAAIIGCGVVWPEGIQGSDYADMHFEHLTELIERNASAKVRATPDSMRIVVGGFIARLIKAKMQFIRRAA